MNMQFLAIKIFWSLFLEQVTIELSISLQSEGLHMPINVHKNKQVLIKGTQVFLVRQHGG